MTTCSKYEKMVTCHSQVPLHELLNEQSQPNSQTEDSRKFFCFRNIANLNFSKFPFQNLFLKNQLTTPQPTALEGHAKFYFL